MVDKPSAPAFSMGLHSSHYSKKMDIVPGPGAYEYVNSIKTSKTQQKVSTSDPRFKNYETLTPGPGTYNYLGSKNEHGPNALIISRGKDKKTQQIPGPGAYQPNFNKITKSHSGFSISHSNKHADITSHSNKMPGPGNYETNYSTVVDKFHAAKFGHEKRSELAYKTNTPGPGQYKQVNVDDLILKKVPKVVFGKSGRSLSTHNIVPGPGTYAATDNFKQSLGKSKGFSISSKFHEAKSDKQKIPGPGSYNLEQIDKITHKNIAFSVGKAPKLKVQNQKQLINLPGPEKYNYNQSTLQSKSGVIGKQKRKGLGEETLVPGPGAYLIKQQNHLPLFSIPKSTTNWKTSDIPGPGTYEPKIIHNEEFNSIKMGQDSRKPIYDDKKTVPGPGSYNYETNSLSGGFKIGNQKRLANKQIALPGPGNYNIPSTIANRPKYSS